MKNLLLTLAVIAVLSSGCSEGEDKHIPGLDYIDLGKIEVERIVSDFEGFEAISFKAIINGAEPYKKKISKVLINSKEPVGFFEMTRGDVTTIIAYEYNFDFQTGDYARIEVYLLR